MEEALDNALKSLGALIDIDLAGKGAVGGMKGSGEMMRLRTPRTGLLGSSSIGGHRRDEFGGYSGRTKENALGKTLFYCAASGSNNKMYFRRPKYRHLPYDLSKRKPLNSILNPIGGPSSSTSTAAATTTTGNEDDDDDDTVEASWIPSLRGPRTRNSESFSSDVCNNGVMFEDTYQAYPSWGPIHAGGGLMMGGGKTDPGPSFLPRSKSLEDLRESPKGLLGRTRFLCSHAVDDSSSNGTGSSNGSNSLESVSPRTSFLNVLKGEASFKHEVDSMSMLIEKLDVA